MYVKTAAAMAIRATCSRINIIDIVAHTHTHTHTGVLFTALESTH